MKGLMSTAASRAWTGVALVGFVAVVLVLGLSLIPRLTSGQQMIDGAKPAFDEERVAGTRAGVSLLSRYVDLADPLLTARGEGATEVRSLVRLMRGRLGLSNAQVRKILRREAPHTEALMRALPLAGVANEIARLTAYLSRTLTMSEDELAATLEQSFPRTAQLLTTLPLVTDGWYDVPGIEGLTRVVGAKPVRTVPGLRKYVRDDVVARMAARSGDFHRLAGRGGVGYIPYLLLLAALVLFAYGLFQARRARTTTPGRSSWRVVVAIGGLLVALVLVGQYLPRLSDGQRLISDLEPVFAQERVKGASTGFETIHEAVVLGDPMMTRRGAASETAGLYRLVADRTGRRSRDVHRALRRRVPRTIALLDTLPLAAVAAEFPRLVRYLARALRLSRGKVDALLRRRTPALARALLAAPAVTAGWSEMPGTAQLTRFDGIMPVRTMPALDDYLRQDLLPVFADEHEHFDRLAGGSPPLDKLAPAVLILGVVLTLYGGAMLRLAARRD
jgi:hypothetical protein